jgi:hypothetical protein
MFSSSLSTSSVRLAPARRGAATRAQRPVARSHHSMRVNALAVGDTVRLRYASPTLPRALASHLWRARTLCVHG